MFRPTKATVSVLIVLITVTIGPMFVFDSPSTQVIPFYAMYWLDLVADAVGSPVAVNGGVDVFKLAKDGECAKRSGLRPVTPIFGGQVV